MPSRGTGQPDPAAPARAIALLGHGNVGSALAERLLAIGQHVTIAVDPDRPDTTAGLRARLPGVRVAPVADAIAAAEVVVLALPFGALAEVLPPIAGSLRGKVLVDATNPIGPGLRHALGSQRSGAEAVAELVPGARVVKAFSVYGAENFATAPHPDAPVRPAMFIAGDDADAKHAVAALLDAMGWDPVDTGPLAQSLHLEHMTMLWVRMVRVDGRSPRLVWAALDS